ncbi:inosine-uridine preferring nucleoside hydrolase [Rhizodiscina lignyota]|uniref:Inosine-uridine preferring nucleoside hydrolase n=1 Tax=Rhizodiscina lignyota TaxID=1504668 RepID=A0A9P4I6Q2_9PEZI|nr:inosine-uridine preferring nucleoside hydrolase [Rhizodiscina lignyota]
MASSGKNKVIIDTDPGVDDVLAMLLAFAATPEEIEISLISVTFGNVDVQNCLRNVVSLFHHIDKEWEWRSKMGKPEGFETLKKHKPLVAIGADGPLADQVMMADFFHGRDGLGGIHASHPHLSPEETWKDLFATTPNSPDAQEILQSKHLFTASKLSAHEQMLQLLRDNEADTITIVAIGPLTNVALAAATDTQTFLRVKEVVVMGGVLDEPGNMTPVAEFNTYADTIAAARVFALTSPNPISTMPPVPPKPAEMAKIEGSEPPPPFLGPYPKKLGKQLKLTLFPLDITSHHPLTRGTFNAFVSEHLSTGSPIAEWVAAFISSTFAKIETLDRDASGDAVSLALHDPLTIWYVLTHPSSSSELASKWRFATPEGEEEDIRVETAGQWTRGMMVVDRRNRKKMDRELEVDGDVLEEVPGDAGNWLSSRAGNRVKRAVGSPGEEEFGSRITMQHKQGNPGF